MPEEALPILDYFEDNYMGRPYVIEDADSQHLAHFFGIRMQEQTLNIIVQTILLKDDTRALSPLLDVPIRISVSF